MGIYEKSRGDGMLAHIVSIPATLQNWWNRLPNKQLTRRGIMELTDEQVSELGLPRRSVRADRLRSLSRR